MAILKLCNVQIKKDACKNVYYASTSIPKQLKEYYKEDSILLLNSYAKLDTYKRFKKVCKFETYLNDVKNTKFRKALTKFRLSAHNLPVERLRYQNVDRCMRTCILCKADIGNEIHYFAECLDESILDLRNTYTQAIFEYNKQLKSFSKNTLFEYALSCSDRGMNHVTAEFVYGIQSRIDNVKT